MTTATQPAKTYQIPANCVVISAYEESHRVSSDHAWLDSGSGFRVNMWNRAENRPETDYISTGWGDGPFPAMPTPDATERDRELYAIHGAARQFIKDALGRAEEAHKIKQGTRVRVVRGRKVPKGEYEVVDHRNGNYGPYVNLRDACGKFHSYVSVENVGVIPDYLAAFDTKGYKGKDRDLPAMMAKTAEEKFSPFAWAVLADWIEEKSLASKVGGTAADFAQAIRTIFCSEDAPRFSTYYADCHNEFRRPFAGV